MENQNELAYKAFLCMLETAENIEYDFYNHISIYHKVETRRKLIGKIELIYSESKQKVRTGWFESRVEKKQFFNVYGEVTNLKDGRKFDFYFCDKVKYQYVESLIEDFREKEEQRKLNSLKELLC